MDYLNKEKIELLKKYDTPTIANALDFFDCRPRNVGFMSSKIKSVLKIDTPMVGYAVTAKCSALNMPTDQHRELWMDYFESVRNTPYAVAVIQDIDPTPIGSFWGEVNAVTHKALGCIGTITQGGVRDLNEVELLDFGYFATNVLVSHAYIHLEEIKCPVQVGGITVNPGDLIHADRHGAILIPNELTHKLPEACEAAIYAEEPVIINLKKAFNNKEKVNLKDLKGWREEMAKRKKEAMSKFSIK